MLCENVFHVSSHLATAEMESDFQPKLANGFSQRPLSILDVYEAIVTTQSKWIQCLASVHTDELVRVYIGGFFWANETSQMILLGRANYVMFLHGRPPPHSPMNRLIKDTGVVN